MVCIRVVIADNQPLMRRAVRQSLESEEDFEVLGEAADGYGAVELALQLDPDVMVIEASIPGLDGPQVTAKVKKMRPRISVLVLSSHCDSHHIVALLNAGADGYLLKTASPELIAQSVRLVHNGGTVLDPVVCGVLVRCVTRLTHSDKPSGSSGAADVLTAREAEVLRFAASGMGNGSIASRLGIAVRTVKGHMVNIFAKLRVGSRTEAVIRGLELGYVRMDEIDTQSDAPDR